MKGDFTRDTFDAGGHFSRVLMQQGRVQLDADWNEQVAIQLHYLRTLAADLIGPHGGPAEGNGFKLDEARDENGAPILCDFAILKGHYYVNGILCENDEDTLRYTTQPHYPLTDGTKLTIGTYLVYLDVWERHLTYVEMENADGSVVSMREVALGGPDTATRAQVVWQVKAKPSNINVADAKDYPKFLAELGDEFRPGTGRLKARAIQSTFDPDDPCNIPSEARYRGPENQLYRVEIHRGGTAAPPGAPDGATFKWSRENGSVIFPIRAIADRSVTLETLGRDARSGLQVGDMVEIVDDNYTLLNQVTPLLGVDAIDYDKNTVTLKDYPAPSVGQDPGKHPLLRRWDQRTGDSGRPTQDGIAIVEGETDQYWIELEDGIQVQFQPTVSQPRYCTGDYWLIPARTATGDVEWPGPVGDPYALGPRGVEHHYAPLWIITVEASREVKADPANELRRTIKPLWQP
jgi:hypothetical protein